MLKRIGALFVIGAASVLAHGQTAVLPIYACTLPGTQALVSNLKSTNYQMGVIPSCTVKVYLTGTTTIATTTPQSPFTANTNGSIPPIYAPTSACYDVVLSGGIAPNNYPTPVTLTDVCPGGGGGGGGVAHVHWACQVWRKQQLAHAYLRRCCGAVRFRFVQWLPEKRWDMLDWHWRRQPCNRRNHGGARRHFREHRSL